ncbi:GNAT family protein [Aureivirga marina]|uniref:GNAT family N-acetyltransferase n=1 Tax=Aureivirga marina TaxID=1182451 RepID=UPI0018CA9158|nr:GNAT family N-acetyltransferase [Aureivirga marina]
MITIKEMKTKKEMKNFVKFPFELYKNNAYWVPPIINDELASLDKTKNPVFENAEARYFVAEKNGEIVGRIAAIINWTEVKVQEKKKMRFGWFDAIDDVAVTEALLNKVSEIGKENNLEFIEGPVGFSNLDKAGLLVKGYEELNTMVTWYNFPYYKEHFEQLSFEKAEEWIEFKFDVTDIMTPKLERFSKLISEKLELNLIDFKSTKEVLPYVDAMFGLINDTYSSLSTYVPIAQSQIEHYKKKYISFIHPSFIKCVADKDGNLIAFGITMPSFSKALQKANGKLFPFGIFHILNAQKNNDKAAFYLIGIKPEYQSKGVTSIIFYEFYKTFIEKGIKHLETNPELEDNVSVQALWKNFDTELHKRRRTYKKEI